MLHIAFKIRERLVFVEKILSGSLIFLLMAIVFWGVLERYLMRSGTGWTDETARYVCIWAVMIGAGIGVVRGAHVGVEVFVYLMPPRWQRFMTRLAYVICGVFCLWIAKVGSTLVAKLFTIMQLTATLEIPIGYIYLALPVGFGLMAVHFALQFLLVDMDKANADGKEGELS